MDPLTKLFSLMMYYLLYPSLAFLLGLSIALSPVLIYSIIYKKLRKRK